jgi:hypothetical protein
VVDIFLMNMSKVESICSAPKAREMFIWNRERAEECANRILASFADEMDLEPEELALDDGYACLAVNRTDVLHLRLAETEPALDLLMELVPLPVGAERLSWCEDMLQGNVFFTGTGGSTLGLDRRQGLATLNLRIFLPGLTPESFRDRLELFLGTVEFWRERLTGASPGMLN